MSPRQQGSAAAPGGVPESAAVASRPEQTDLLTAELLRLRLAQVGAVRTARALLVACEQDAAPASLAAAAAAARTSAAEVWETASNVVLLRSPP